MMRKLQTHFDQFKCITKEKCHAVTLTHADTV